MSSQRWLLEKNAENPLDYTCRYVGPPTKPSPDDLAAVLRFFFAIGVIREELVNLIQIYKSR